MLGNIADGQSLNRFAYVTGNPISFIDPFGLLRTAAGYSFSDDNIAAIADIMSYLVNNYPELLQRVDGRDVNMLFIPWLSLSYSDFNGLPLVGFHLANHIFLPIKMCQLGTGELSDTDEINLYNTLFHEFLHPYLDDRLSFFDRPNATNELLSETAQKYHNWIYEKSKEIYSHYQLPDAVRKKRPAPRIDDFGECCN